MQSDVLRRIFVFHKQTWPPQAILVSDWSISKIFSNWPIRNKNCLWQPCLLTDWDKMSTLYREPSIDASYQVLVHLAKLFQRRRSSSSRYGVNSSTSRLKLQRMVGEQQKIARVCTIKKPTRRRVHSISGRRRSSPLKQLGQMNQNLVCSIYGRSSVKIAHFVSTR
jgi:hypothetical protein